jgi:hypothetical protein
LLDVLFPNINFIEIIHPGFSSKHLSLKAWQIVNQALPTKYTNGSHLSALRRWFLISL